MSEQLPILHIRADQMQLMLAVVGAARKYREVRSRHVGQQSTERDIGRALAWRALCAALDAYEGSIRERYEAAIAADEAVDELRRHGDAP